MIIVDSREKKNQHILDYFDRTGEEYQIRALSTGDYMLDSSPGITIDRKRDLQELAGNICTADHRFWREARRSHEQGLKMIVLIEDNRIQSMNEVPKWKSKYSKVTGRMLYNEMFRIHVAYQIEFLFCDRQSTGKRILEILRNG